MKIVLYKDKKEVLPKWWHLLIRLSFRNLYYLLPSRML